MLLQRSHRRFQNSHRKGHHWPDAFLLIGLIALPLSWCVADLVTPAMADFSDNCPKECTCKWANGKREADCNRAGFTAVPTHLNHEIQILRMTHNYVRNLGREVFKSAGLLNLQRIFMNHCHVQEIDSTAFRDLRILVELDLSNNNLTHLEPETFAGNERLQTLTLSHNNIAQLSPYAFPPAKHLKTIDLSHNKIEEIDRRTFENLGNSVESVFVDNNRLRTLREEVFVPLTNLKSLQLHNNPWTCDCRLKNFRDWVVFRGLYTYPTSCAEPERLADKLWQDVNPKDFACKPEIRVPQSVVFSQPGANVTLSCFIIGSPMPDAKWVLKGRIVNNNTVPAGGPVPPSQPPSSQTTTPSGELSRQQQQLQQVQQQQSGIMNSVPTQFLIHEEGGLERWFNLTIINVGLESVADYTCVAVNAGGVMEENISLTFEEPEPVGLPGGKKEESNLAIIIGAAAGGFFFVVVLLMVLCCCCCRRRTKNTTPTNSSSQGGATPTERHGSIIGFADSSQKLLQQSQQYSTTRSPSLSLRQSASKHSRMEHDGPDYQCVPQSDMELMSTSSGGTTMLPTGSPDNQAAYEMELRTMRSPPHHHHHQQQLRQQQQQPKTMMVTSNGVSGENYHSLTDPDHYPDLLDLHPKRSVVHTHGQAPLKQISPTKKASQPLNPAALVVPPTPPLQFPHQFPHLIHSSSGPKASTAARAHSPTNPVAVSPLLSPPAQFSTDIPKHMAKGYVTLPRRLIHQPAPPTGVSTKGMIDWASMTERAPICDGVGPRTSATGSSALLATQRPNMANCPCPTIPEGDEHIISSHGHKRSLSMKRLPPPGQVGVCHENRDSSGSEVTLGGEDSISSYCEPFGKALPPLTSNNKNRDSIASTESDLEAILSDPTSRRSAAACPLHKLSSSMGGHHPKIISIPKDTHQPVVQVQKAPRALKGILKGGSMSKSGVAGSPVAASSSGQQPPPTSITTNPVASVTMQQQGGNKPNIIVISRNGGRDSSSSSSPPPLSDIKSFSHHISCSSNSNNGGSASKSVPKPPIRSSSNTKNSEALNV